MQDARHSSGALLVVALVAAILGSVFTYGWIHIAEPVPGLATPGSQSVAAVPMMDSNAITRAAEIIGPSVVNIDTKTFSAHPSMRGGDDEFFHRFFGHTPDGAEPEPQKGVGSGVIVSPDGYVLTNDHVIEGANEITVTLTNKTQYKAKVLGADRLSDIAILKIEATNLPVAQLGDSEAVKVGQWVVAVGNPYQFEHTVTVGVISGRGRTLPNEGIKEYRDLLQTDAAINPGNSGGPLCDLQGRVIGINTAIIPFAQGIGFSIPINTVKNIMDQLIKSGKVVRSFLGIKMSEVTDEEAAALHLTDKTAGVVVRRVVEGSPAEKAGLQKGDLIVDLDGQKFNSVQEFQSLVRSRKVGAQSRLKVLRDGKYTTLSVTIGEMPGNLQ